MPRILDTRVCPHCKAELPEPTPRTCPHCAGSLQKRFLTAGCLSSAPPVLALAVGLGLAAWALRGAPPEEGGRAATAPRAAAPHAPGATDATGAARGPEAAHERP